MTQTTEREEMSSQNWQCKEGDPFAPAAPDTLEHLPSHHCAEPEIDPRFAAAHYEHDLKPAITDIKARLRTKTPNVWLMMRVAEDAAQHIAMLESEAEQLRMSWANAEKDSVRFVLFFEAMIADIHGAKMTPVQVELARIFKEVGGDPSTVDEIRDLIDAAMTKDAE